MSLAARPVFAAPEWWNHRPAVEAMASRIAEWTRITHDADFNTTPCDPSNYGSQFITPATSQETCLLGPTRPNERLLGKAWLPPSGVPAQYSRLRVDLYMRLAGADAVGVIRLVTGSGRVVEVPYSYALLGHQFGGWISADVYAIPGDTLTINGQYTAGNAWCYGCSARWLVEYPSVDWTENSWYTLAPGHVVAGRPLHAHLLRWLGRAANGFGARSRQVISKWWGPWNKADSVTDPAEPYGRYKVTIGANVTSVVAHVLCKLPSISGGGDLSVRVVIGGGFTYTGIISVPNSLDFAWYETLIPIPVSRTERTAEIRINVDNTADAWQVASVCAYEDDVSLGAIPGAPGLVYADPGAPATTMDAAFWSRAVLNMHWLWRYRAARPLVNDCRWRMAMPQEDGLDNNDWSACLARYRVHVGGGDGGSRLVVPHMNVYDTVLSEGTGNEALNVRYPVNPFISRVFRSSMVTGGERFTPGVEAGYMRWQAGALANTLAPAYGLPEEPYEFPAGVHEIAVYLSPSDEADIAHQGTGFEIRNEGIMFEEVAP